MFRLCAATLVALISAAALADGDRHGRVYEVTITNITKGQTFTPQLVATHSHSVKLFELGDEASEALGLLAEGGDTMPLTRELEGLGRDVAEVVTIGRLVGPGETSSMKIRTSGFRSYLSVAAMLIPTNDTFVALNRVRLPEHGSRTYHAAAYDAGTEANDQNCANIPGPVCMGAGPSPGMNEGDEGYVYIGNGFHDLEGGPEDVILGPAMYDWNNPVATVKVRRIRH